MTFKALDQKKTTIIIAVGKKNIQHRQNAEAIAPLPPPELMNRMCVK